MAILDMNNTNYLLQQHSTWAKDKMTYRNQVYFEPWVRQTPKLLPHREGIITFFFLSSYQSLLSFSLLWKISVSIFSRTSNEKT